MRKPQCPLGASKGRPAPVREDIAPYLGTALILAVRDRRRGVDDPEHEGDKSPQADTRADDAAPAAFGPAVIQVGIIAPGYPPFSFGQRQTSRMG